MTVQWRKIRGDYRQRKRELLLIGAVLACSSAGVVAALDAQSILRREIAASFEAALAPDLSLWFTHVDAKLLAAIRAQPGIAEADARRVALTRVHGPHGEWIPARVSIRADYMRQAVGAVHRDGGTLPAASAGVLIEQSSWALLGTPAPNRLTWLNAQGAEVVVPLGGTVHDPGVAPSSQERVIYAYLNPDAAEKAGLDPSFDQVLVRLRERGTLTEASDFGDALSERLKAHQLAPIKVQALQREHPHAALMNTMLNILAVMAALAFCCGATAAMGLMSYWMKREGRLVGIMKTLGATSWQLVAHYLALVAPLLIAANLTAWFAGSALARAMVRYYQISLNIDLRDLSAPSGLIAWEFAFTLGIPLAALAVPIIRAARRTPRGAIQDAGIVAPSGRCLGWARHIAMTRSQPMTLVIRNTFRRPGRLAVAILTLSSAGGLLLTASNTNLSLLSVVDATLNAQSHDLEIFLQRPAAIERLESVAGKILGVTRAEAWRAATVKVGAGRSALLHGYPIGTKLFSLSYRAGGPPGPDELDGVVVTSSLMAQQRQLAVGQKILVRYGDRATTERITGVVDEIAPPSLYASAATFQRITGLGALAQVLRVTTAADATGVIAEKVDLALAAADLTPAFVQNRQEVRTALKEHFNVVTEVVRWVALAAALVGGIVLATMLCLGVVERTREVGVMRTLGATPTRITFLFVAEGVVVAGLSAALASIGAYFGSKFVIGMASTQMLHAPVPLVLSGAGFATLAAGSLIILLAAWIPTARLCGRAARESLAYE